MPELTMERSPRRTLEMAVAESVKLPPFLTPGQRPLELTLRRCASVDLPALRDYFAERQQAVEDEMARRIGCDRCHTMASCKATDDGECAVHG